MILWLLITFVMMIVSALFEYPVKGLKAHEICCATVNKRGLAMDRRWMLVDEEGVFLSQRTLSALTQFAPGFDDRLSIKYLPSGEEQVIELESFSEQMEVNVWGQDCLAHAAVHGVNDWLSDKLDKKVRLVYMNTNDIRPVESSENDDIVSFADGYPVLLASNASLADLNNRLAEPIGMERFRPNIVIDGEVPYEEDGWQRIKVGTVIFRVVKTCARCHVINIDQTTGLSTKEPLKTLSTYRKEGNKVNFAVNLIPENEGIIHEEDEVVILA